MTIPTRHSTSQYLVIYRLNEICFSKSIDFVVLKSYMIQIGANKKSYTILMRIVCGYQTSDTLLDFPVRFLSDSLRIVCCIVSTMEQLDLFPIRTRIGHSL